MEKENLQTIDAYIDNCPEEIRNRLQELRRIIREVEPTMTEKIAWQMPSFYLNGPIIHFATNKKHIGLYPGPEVIEVLKDRLTGYKTSKGTIQIPNNQEFDRQLIEDIVRYNLLRKEK